ncbi:MAG: hypothetical protein LBG98_02655 [Puniceicoccales bacterium]|jgi:hypothetical protein|nr:hypothetical protein [Puniceicoccales bacterium]
MNFDIIHNVFYGLHEILLNIDWPLLFHDIFYNITLRYLILFWISIRIFYFLTCPHRKLCVSQGKIGSIFLQKSALKDILIQTCFDQGIRTKPHIAIHIHRHINIDISFKIVQHQPLQELGARLQFELHRLLSDDLGIDKKVHIHLFVTGFLRSQRSPVPVAAESIADRETSKFLEKTQSVHECHRDGPCRL